MAVTGSQLMFNLREQLRKQNPLLEMCICWRRVELNEGEVVIERGGSLFEKIVIPFGKEGDVRARLPENCLDHGLRCLALVLAKED